MDIDLDLTGRRVPLAAIPALAVALALVVAVVSPGTAQAAVTPFSISTPYPAVDVAPGTSVSFDVTVQTPSPERVDLSLSGVPKDWKAMIHGGGTVIDAVETGGATPPSVRVDVKVPASATGMSTITLAARAPDGTRTLPLTVRVAPSVGGDISLSTDFPSLQGPAGQAFSFNLTLDNGSAEDVTFAVNAQGPTGWTVDATLTGKSQAASAVVKAGSTSGITVTAEPPSDVAAGTYPIDVVATAGSQQIPGTLQVVVTGSYKLAMSTPDSLVSTSGDAGESHDFAITLTDSGTSPISNVKLDSTAPSGWKVTFDPATVPSLDAGATQTVTAHIVPSGDAVAGDYVVTLKASGDQSTSASEDIRFTVETSTGWALIGIALIVLVLVGTGWVFVHFGRR